MPRDPSSARRIDRASRARGSTAKITPRSNCFPGMFFSSSALVFIAPQTDHNAILVLNPKIAGFGNNGFPPTLT
jgi:hypothetical protein